MLQDNYHVQAHNNATENLLSPALRQIVDLATRTLKDAGEAFRVRARRFDNSEIVQVFTISTDHKLHFCVLRSRPGNVHIKAMRYRSVYDDSANAGWTSPRTCDFLTNVHNRLDQPTLTGIEALIGEWLFLNATNARTPRETFLAIDGVSSAPSRFAAGTFVIDSINMQSNSDLRIAVQNTSQNCQIWLNPEYSQHLNEPMGMKGCRAVIHHDGVVRVLREQNFRQLYELSGSRSAVRTSRR